MIVCVCACASDNVLYKMNIVNEPENKNGTQTGASISCIVICTCTHIHTRMDMDTHGDRQAHRQNLMVVSSFGRHGEYTWNETTFLPFRSVPSLRHNVPYLCTFPSIKDPSSSAVG